MLKGFIAYLSEYPNAILISYSGTHLDRRVILLRLDHFGLPAPAGNQFTDALHIIKRALAMPTGNYKLKKVASALGYRFRHPDLDGLDIATQYFDRIDQGKDPITQQMLEYNEDDVLSLRHLCCTVENICNAHFESHA